MAATPKWPWHPPNHRKQTCKLFLFPAYEHLGGKTSPSLLLRYKNVQEAHVIGKRGLVFELESFVGLLKFLLNQDIN